MAWWGWSLTADPLVRKSTVNVSVYQLKDRQIRGHFESRSLTESEQIELRSVEHERDVILNRLAAKG